MVQIIVWIMVADYSVDYGADYDNYSADYDGL